MRPLSRDDFRDAVFARDGMHCVICRAPAADAHHVVERKLWDDGGYYLDNGVSVCADHHIAAEQTTLSCEELRKAAGIKKIVLPTHLYVDQAYDKWGNPVLPNGTRLRGELFTDPSVQKVLGEGGVLALFTTRVKFPRTHHLPWSPGKTHDDRVMDDSDPFSGQDVIATIKMDGENTTFYRDYIHARSLDYASHPARDWVKARWARVAHEIPEGWRVCGENVFAVHSIRYEHLEDWFLVFQIWNDQNVCLSWEETCEYASLLELPLVPVLYKGPGDRAQIEDLYRPTHLGDSCEGHVVRVPEAFPAAAYRRCVGKYVRAGHVTTQDHWMHAQIQENGRHHEP